MCPDVDRAFFIGTHVNRSVPVEAKLAFAVVRLRFNRAGFQRNAIHAPNLSALRLGVNIVGVGRVRKNPKAVAAEKVFPTAVRDSTRVSRISHPHAVVLQPAENVIWIGCVNAHVIELRNRQVVSFPPGISAVVGVPNSAVISCDHMLRIVRINPNVVEIPVSAARNIAEAFSAVAAHDQAEVRLINFVFVLGVDDQVGKIKRTPHHQLAAVTLLPGFSAILGAKQRAAIGFDQGIHDIRIGRRNGHSDASPRFRREPLGAFFVQFAPSCAAVCCAEETTGARRGGILSAGAERPALAPEIPHADKNGFRVAWIHGHHRAAGGKVDAFQNVFPRLPAIGGLVNTAVFTVAPQFARDADIHGVAVFRINQYLRNSLGILQTHVDPVFAAVSGLIDSITDRDAVTRPRFSGADPNRFGRLRVNRDRAD